MSDDQRIASDEEKARLTREWLNSDHYKLVFVPEIERLEAIVKVVKRKHSMDGNASAVLACECYHNALDDIRTQIMLVKDSDKAPDPKTLETDYSGPRYPKEPGEE